MNSLTKEQTALLLNVLRSELEPSRHKKEVREANVDMARTTADALDLIHEKSVEVERIRMASDTLLVERWLDLWRQWDGIASRIGEPAGAHATRDAPGEASGFDARSLADELESAAERMLLVMDDVFPLIDAPGLFSLALDDLAERISSHPHWMGAEESARFHLGRTATLCVLRWQWLARRQEAQPHPGRRFAHAIYKILNDNTPVLLDPEEVIDFFTGLPVDVCREIYSLFKENPRGFNPDDPTSIWFAINRSYEERFDS